MLFRRRIETTCNHKIFNRYFHKREKLMSPAQDSIGDLLRNFYTAYGMPNEGPPQDLDVNAVIGTKGLSQDDYDLLHTALSNQLLRRQFLFCRNILEDLANRLTTQELLQEMSNSVSLSNQEFDELSNGVAWFSLAASLDKRQDGLPLIPFDNQLALPFPLKISMVIQGSLVLRLYIALVYLRGGVMSNAINRAARTGNPCSLRVKKLLNSDYVRHLRNALSHGSFSACIAGIAFRDEDSKNKEVIIATPQFMDWLCLWLMLIPLQILTAVS
jgi:hypothetical protein